MRAYQWISAGFLWAMQPLPTLAQPSFDCSRANTPDLVAICQSPTLSALDRVANQGYLYIRSSLGPSTANSINRPLIAARQRCGLDQTCIEAQQIDAIKTFRAYGAPIIASADTGKDLCSIPKINQGMEYDVAKRIIIQSGFLSPSLPSAYGYRQND